MTRVVVATAKGISVVGATGGPGAGESAVALDRWGDGWVAATADGTVLRSDDALQWQPMASSDAELTCVLESRDGPVWVGTEGAHLLRLEDSALTQVEGFEAVDGRGSWYTPWGGPPALRSLAAATDGTLYANVHVGGIVRSLDGGRSWTPTLDIDFDVHQVVVDPGSGTVHAPGGGGGVATSQDRGETWTSTREGLHAGYCRAAAVSASFEYASACVGPFGGRAAVYRRPRGTTQPFSKCGAGLPEWFDGNIDTFWIAAAGQTVAFASPQGDLYLSTDDGDSWEQVVSGLTGVVAVALAD